MYNIVKNGETLLVGKRTIVNLNGDWQVGESVGADAAESAYDHSCAVPGLLSNAKPGFQDVGEFKSRMLQYCFEGYRTCTGGVVDIPMDEKALAGEFGVSYQERSYFWYKKTFLAPKRHQHADLIVLKARFGSKVWVNGEVVGENNSCFTSACYDVAELIRWGEENEIIIRVGAHQEVLPKGTLNMEDCEIEKWYPGIWDDVELYCYNGIKVQSVQIAPKVSPKQITVETELKNAENESKEIVVTQIVKSADQKKVIAECTQKVELNAMECKAVQCTIELPEAELWTPEKPVLYVLETVTDGDSELNRFGVREVEFRSETERFYLNNEVYFLRGGQMTLGRFFQDPLSGTLPWDEAWVRALLGDSRRSMHWNMTKFSINNPPRKWLEIADEEGLLNVLELPIWCFNPKNDQSFNGYKKSYDLPRLMKDVETFVRDQRCHPSVMYWSAALETVADWLGEEVIPLGRSLDLEKRAWHNSYGTPVGPDDPIEDHPYEFTTNGLPEEWHVPGFDMKTLESKGGFERQSTMGTPGVPSGHAHVLSEFGWLWLRRDGEPCLYLANTYNHLPYPHDTPEERLETCAYLLGGLVEYWRAHRNYAQVMHHVWLACDIGDRTATCDNYADPRTLEFQPAYIRYVAEAYKPMGIYLEFWKREVQAGENRIFYVMMVNDHPEEKTGEINLVMKYEDGTILDLGKRSFYMRKNGSVTVKYDINMPEKLGKTEMIATAVSSDGYMSRSIRKVEVKAEIPPRPYGEW